MKLEIKNRMEDGVYSIIASDTRRALAETPFDTKGKEDATQLVNRYNIHEELIRDLIEIKETFELPGVINGTWLENKIKEMYQKAINKP